MLIKSCSHCVKWTLYTLRTIWVVMDMWHVALFPPKRFQLEVSEQYSRDHKEQHKISVHKVLAKHFPQNSEASKITWTFNISSTSSRKDPIDSGWCSLSPNPSSEATAIFGLRIHSRLGLEEPLNGRNVAVISCQMQRCPTSGAKWKLWKLWPLKTPP